MRETEIRLRPQVTSTPALFQHQYLREVSRRIPSQPLHPAYFRGPLNKHIIMSVRGHYIPTVTLTKRSKFAQKNDPQVVYVNASPKPLTFTLEIQHKHKGTLAKPPKWSLCIFCVECEKAFRHGHDGAGTAFRGETGSICVREHIVVGNAAGGCHVEPIPNQGYKNEASKHTPNTPTLSSRVGFSFLSYKTIENWQRA